MRKTLFRPMKFFLVQYPQVTTGKKFGTLKYCQLGNNNNYNTSVIHTCPAGAARSHWLLGYRQPWRWSWCWRHSGLTGTPQSRQKAPGPHRSRPRDWFRLAEDSRTPQLDRPSRRAATGSLPLTTAKPQRVNTERRKWKEAFCDVRHHSGYKETKIGSLFFSFTTLFNFTLCRVNCNILKRRQRHRKKRVRSGL